MAELRDRQRIKLTFVSAGPIVGPVPITLVAAKLQALQNLLFHAAAAIVRDPSSRRGLWFNRYRDKVELTFVASHSSDLVIEAELAPRPVLHETLDIGRQAVDLLFRVGNAIETGNRARWDLGREDSNYLIRAYENLAPSPADEYHVAIENCQVQTHPRLLLTPESRQKARLWAVTATQPMYEEEVTIVGELIKIHIDAGDDKITVRSNRREVDCSYPNAMRDQVANLLAGSTVEVTGRATLHEEGGLKQLVEVYDVETVSMDPLRLVRFDSAGRRFDLGEPIMVNVEYMDGLWVYSNEALNLWGYGARREDALRDLHDNFAYNYREIAEAPDEELDGIAQELKAKLCRLAGREEL